jgi:hypothetical protein
MTDLAELAELADLTGLSDDERQTTLADGRKASRSPAWANSGSAIRGRSPQRGDPARTRL